MILGLTDPINQHHFYHFRFVFWLIIGRGYQLDLLGTGFVPWYFGTNLFDYHVYCEFDDDLYFNLYFVERRNLIWDGGSKY